MNGLLFVIDQLGVNVATLTAANQEQKKLIAQMRQEIEALKAKSEESKSG